MTLATTLYEDLRDLGSFIAGFLALLAGVIAYRAGMIQADVGKRQIDQSIKAEDGRLARDTLAAARLLNGTLSFTLKRITRAFRHLRNNQADLARSSLTEIAFYKMAPWLALMDQTFITSYFEFAASVTALLKSDPQSSVTVIAPGEASARMLSLEEQFQDLQRQAETLINLAADTEAKELKALHDTIKLLHL